MEAWLHDQVACVGFSETELVLSGRAHDERVRELREEVRREFGVDLSVRFEDVAGAATVQEQKEARAAAERQSVLDDPAVRRVMDIFPAAQLIEYDLTGTEDADGAGVSAHSTQRNAL